MGDKKEGNFVYLPAKPQIQNPEPCGEEKLNLYFYYGLEPWYKNALDFASGVVLFYHHLKGLHW